MRFNHDFRADLATLMHEAEHGDPFAFVRFCDGEHAIMENKDIPTADGWRVGNKWMMDAMMNAFTARLPRYYRGIPCVCCWPNGHEWALHELAHEREITTGHAKTRGDLTFSNLFVNGNYDTARPWLGELARNWCVVSCAWGSDIRVPADWSKIDDLERYVWHTVEALAIREQPALIAAGPLGKVLAHRLWFKTRMHTILDIGSALDPDLFGKGNRGYHDPNHPNRKKVCVWSVEVVS